MFWATRMVPVRVLCLDRTLRSLMTALAHMNVIHLSADRPDGFHQLLARGDTRLTEVEERLVRLSPESIRVAPRGSARLLHEAFQPTSELAATLDDVEQTLSPLRETEQRIRREIAEATEIQGFLEPLEASGLSLSALRDLRFVALFVGMLPTDGLGQLAASLSRVPHGLASASGGAEHLRVWVVVSREHAAQTAAVLDALYFSPWALPEGDSLTSLLDDVEESTWRLREELAVVQAEIRAHTSRYRPLLQQVAEAVAARRLMMESLSCIARSERTCLVSGWVPARRHKELREAVARFPSREAVLVEASVAGEPPTEFRRPAWLRSFGALAEGYGQPPSHGIDPAPFVALSFLGLFGIMFADVGHGTLLILAALMLRVFLPKGIGKHAGLVGMAGLSAVLFGVVFGSLFGREDLIRPLWFHPFSHVERLLVLALGVGMGLLSLGFLLNIVQALHARRLREGLLGAHGVVGLLFYWSVAGLAALVLTGATPPVPWTVLLLWAAMLLLVAAVAPTIRAEKGAALDASAGVLELAVGLLANTLSFLRVAAFHLSHAGLCLAVFSLARELGDVASSPELSVSIVVEGQLLIILLEGLVISIQCLRLNYYEFFSRFFHDGGTAYRPFGAALAER